MIAIAIGAVGLGLSRLPPWMLALLFVTAGLALGPPLLARKGLKLLDIVAVLAIALLTIGLLLPAMVQTRFRSAGQRTLPVSIPTGLYSFLFDGR
jgi:hypothetical protein